MGGGSGGSGSGGRSGGGGSTNGDAGQPGEVARAVNKALEAASNPDKLISDMKQAKYGDFKAHDKAQYTKYALEMQTAQARNDAKRASDQAMRAKSQYGAAKKTYKGIDKDPAYSKAKSDSERLFKKYNDLAQKSRNLENAFKSAGLHVSGTNPYGPKYDIKVT